MQPSPLVHSAQGWHSEKPPFKIFKPAVPPFQSSTYCSVLNRAQLFAMPWTVARQVCPPLGDLPDSGIKPMSPASLALAGGFFTIERPGKPPLLPSSHQIYLGFGFLVHRISEMLLPCPP